MTGKKCKKRFNNILIPPSEGRSRWKKLATKLFLLKMGEARSTRKVASVLTNFIHSLCIKQKLLKLFAFLQARFYPTKRKKAVENCQDFFPKLLTSHRKNKKATQKQIHQIREWQRGVESCSRMDYIF